MLINGLCEYYDILASQGKVIPNGFSNIDVSYLIELSTDGNIEHIVDYRTWDTTGKKPVSKPTQVTTLERAGKSAIASEKIEHRGEYIFGLKCEVDKLTKEKYLVYSKDKYNAFIKTNLEFIEGIDSPVVNAFREYLNNWKPDEQYQNELLLNLGKDVAANFIFCLSGHSEKLLHEDSEIIKKWNMFRSSASEEDKLVSQCAITGENIPIARLHNKIKGIRGSNASGANLISFNGAAEESYCREQSYNSNISETAMKKYTEALNYLLSSKNNHKRIDETTVIYWVESRKSQSDELLSFLLFEDDEAIDDSVLESIMEDCHNGNLTEEKLANVDDIDCSANYYIVGIKPNNARLSVKFIYRNQLGKLLLNVSQHQKDLKIIGINKSVSMWRIGKELISPKSSNDNVNPALVSKLFESVINGTPYPDSLLSGIINRVKTDSDYKVNAVRAAIIKACINRKLRIFKNKEELNMAIDRENQNQAYLCGRLFAVLEQIQLHASGYSLNRTIKDAYFSSAASRPAVVFPRILNLSQHHLSKLGNPVYYQNDISEITAKLKNEFPTALNLTEQGKFIIGYYHQTEEIKNNRNKNKKTEE
ncbi:MAG: type I-C CRISPR-associated protein Cas8c/Csd1 [Clostridia bacterium]|nr:type I-C CRISPR-associated protein Cas8c/Csd1 [Clostridia bacterium]